MELSQQIAALLCAGDEEDLAELKGLQQQLSDVCYRQASQLEARQNVLQSAHDFHGTAQDVRPPPCVTVRLLSRLLRVNGAFGIGFLNRGFCYLGVFGCCCRCTEVSFLLSSPC